MEHRPPQPTADGSEDSTALDPTGGPISKSGYWLAFAEGPKAPFGSTGVQNNGKQFSYITPRSHAGDGTSGFVASSFGVTA